MPPVENVIAVAMAGFLLSATPGPSMLYVLSRSVGQSRAAGLASALGLALGGVVLAVATALGLAELFEKMPGIVVALRYAGSAYLAWLGISMIWTARQAAHTKLQVNQVTVRSIASIIWQGVLVELLNPKTVLFFALFLPPFVELGQSLEEGAEVRTQLLVLGALVPLTAIPSDLLIAYMGGTLARNINKRQRLREWMGVIGGVLLILIAANLHLGFL